MWHDWHDDVSRAHSRLETAYENARSGHGTLLRPDLFPGASTPKP